MPRAVTPGLEQRLNQGAIGGQDLLIIAAVPASAPNELIGTPLVDATLTVSGLYRCLVPIAGIASVVQVYVNATFSGGTVSSDFDTLFHLYEWPTIPAKKGATVSGDGSLSTTVLQSIETTDVNGEQYAVLDLTLTGITSVTFTVAEWNGK